MLELSVFYQMKDLPFSNNKVKIKENRFLIQVLFYYFLLELSVYVGLHDPKRKMQKITI